VARGYAGPARQPRRYRVPKLQEIGAEGGVFEGDSTVTGEYDGQPVTGQAYTEQLGDWHS
jgi:hypothetical protein